ncbi:MAG: hypothetical protein BWY86_00864 [Candidatus Aminicenantes bacterium ADurb.Bin508]|nr:MAG: hypothetical protein BWY86_00864 [Candidatus Aminicenantes bacterium ADurb.Bin508]
MTEEFVFQEVFRNRAAVDRDEGTPGTPGEGVDSSGEELLPRSALPGEKNRDVQGGDLVDEPVDLEHAPPLPGYPHLEEPSGEGDQIGRTVSFPEGIDPTGDLFGRLLRVLPGDDAVGALPLLASPAEKGGIRSRPEGEQLVKALLLFLEEGAENDQVKRLRHGLPFTLSDGTEVVDGQIVAQEFNNLLDEALIPV